MVREGRHAGNDIGRVSVRARAVIAVLAVLGCLVLATAVSTPVALAATIQVTTSNDEINVNGQCSLREAIRNANLNSQGGSIDCLAGSGPDTITFAAGTDGNPITLTIAGDDDV